MTAFLHDPMLPGIVFQMGPGTNFDMGLGASLGSGAISAFLTTLIVGAIMIAVAPTYTEQMMQSVRADPIGSFIYGFVALVALLLLILVLVITIVGILIAIPLGLLAVVVWAVGAAIGYLAIADRLIGRQDGWLKPLLLAAAINGLLTLTGIGGLIAFAIGAAGFGAVLRSQIA